MARLEVTREYPGETSSECFQACVQAAIAAGYSIVKKREIASLVVCRGCIQNAPVELSLMVPLGSPTRVHLALSGDRCSQEALVTEAERLYRFLELELTR